MARNEYRSSSLAGLRLQGRRIVPVHLEIQMSSQLVDPLSVQVSDVAQRERIELQGEVVLEVFDHPAGVAHAIERLGGRKQVLLLDELPGFEVHSRLGQKLLWNIRPPLSSHHG